MATTAQPSHLNSIRRYFSKKGKPDSPDVTKKINKLDVENSDSEFELVHERKNNSSLNKSNKASPSKSKNASPRKSKKSEVLDVLNESDSDNNELGIFHSTAIDTVLEDKSINLKSSNIDSSVKRSPQDDGDSSSSDGRSSDSDTPVVKNNSPSNTESEEDIIPATQEISQSLLFDISLKNKKNTVSKNILKSKSISTNRKADHSLSDDDTRSSERNSSKEDSSSEEEKEGSSKNLSPDKPRNSADAEINDSSAKNLASDDTWLGQWKSKKTPLARVHKKSSQKPFFFNDLDDEEDYFVAQCPNQINPKSLTGSEIALDGDCNISVGINDESVSFECVSNTVNAGRLLNILLADNTLSSFHCGHFTLAGSLVLTEDVPLPSPQKPTSSPSKRVEFPEKFQELCPSFPEANAPSGMSSFCSFPSQQVLGTSIEKYFKKKKHKNRENTSQEVDTSLLETSADAVFSGFSKKKKKSKIKDEPDSMISDCQPAIDSNESIVEHRKKRKRSLDDYESNFEETHHRKKRKKKSKGIEDFPEVLADSEETPVPDIVKIEPEETEPLDPNYVKKRKKKKSKHSE